MRLALALLVSYGLVISTWTVYNWLAWERLVIGGEGFVSFIYQGATDKASPEELDEELGVSPENAHQQRQEAMREGIEETILQRSDRVGAAPRQRTGRRLSAAAQYQPPEREKLPRRRKSLAAPRSFTRPACST